MDARTGGRLVGRSQETRVGLNPEAGLAALKAVEREDGDPALALLDLLRNYAIYEPNTPTLRGNTPELQPRDPVGLSGGGLPQAIPSLDTHLSSRRGVESALPEFPRVDRLAKSMGAAPGAALICPFRHFIPFGREICDRFMKEGRNVRLGERQRGGALRPLCSGYVAR